MDARGQHAPRAVRVRRLSICAGLILATGAYLAGLTQLSDTGSDRGTVRIASRDGRQDAVSPLPRAVASPLNAFELHGIARSPAPAAMLAEHDERPRWFGKGDVVRGSIRLEEVAAGHVVLFDGTQRLRLDLPQRLGGSGEPVPAALRGLRPEPRPPSGERSGIELAAEAAASPNPAPEPATPEEREAARTAQLPNGAT